MAEIKAVASRLFDDVPYSEITLSMIAKDLSWTRANLYRYVDTKEEIYLALHEDCMIKYYKDLETAFPKGSNISLESSAEVWAGILMANCRYLMMGHILWAVVETSISAERLDQFRGLYGRVSNGFLQQIADELGITLEQSRKLSLSIYYHGMGLVCSRFTGSKMECGTNSFGVPVCTNESFKREMAEFILMLLFYVTGDFGDGRKKSGSSACPTNFFKDVPERNS